MAGLFNKALNYLHSSGDGTENDFVGKIIYINKKSYRVVRLLAEGGFAYVFLAVEVSSGRMVALKRLIIPDKDHLRLAKAEADVMRLCSQCPFVVKLLDSTTVAAQDTQHNNMEMLIVMELCPGSLVHILYKRAQGFEPHDVMRIMEPIVSAVAFLHSQSPPIIHRDLKMENILVSTEGQVKLCDFGSCTTDVMQPVTTAQVATAEDEIQMNTTPQYRAPEMWDLYSRVPINEKSDIWALGCILYKLCHYRSPFDEGSQMAICSASLRLPSDGPNTIFHPLLQVLLCKNPSDRPSALEVLSELETIKKTLKPNNVSRVDVLAVEPPTLPPMASDGLGEVKSQMTQTLRGVYNNIMTAVDGIAAMPMPSAGTKTAAQSTERAETSTIEWSYITPRLIAMSVPTHASVNEMLNVVETNHRNRYFIFDLSNMSYNDGRVANRVRHVQYPSKGCLGLSNLWELCESIHAWLLADRENVALIHCNNGLDRTGPILASYMLFCGLFTNNIHAFTHFTIKRGLPFVPKPSALRLANYIRAIAHDEKLPHHDRIVIRRISYPSLPVLISQPSLPYPVALPLTHNTLNFKPTSPNKTVDTVYMDMNQTLLEDFMVFILLPKKDKSVQLCHLQLHAGFLEAGSHRYVIADLDRPNKSLTSDFYIEIDMSLDTTTDNGYSPWESGVNTTQNALATCFFTDSEGKGLIKSFERAIATKLGESQSQDVTPRSPRRPVTKDTRPASYAGHESPHDTNPVKSLIDFSDSDAVPSASTTSHRQSPWKEEKKIHPDSSTDNTETLLDFSSSSIPTVPVPTSLISGPSQHSILEENQLLDEVFTQSPNEFMQPEQQTADHQQPSIPRVHSSNFLSSTPIENFPRSYSALDCKITPPTSATCPAPTNNNKPRPNMSSPQANSDPFGSLLGGFVSPGGNTSLNDKPVSTQGNGLPNPAMSGPSRSLSSQGPIGQPNYRVNSYRCQQSVDPNLQPAKNQQRKSDLFEGLTGLDTPKNSSPTGNRSQSPGAGPGSPPVRPNTNYQPSLGHSGGSFGGVTYGQSPGSSRAAPRTTASQASQQKKTQWNNKMGMTSTSSPMSAHQGRGGSTNTTATSGGQGFEDLLFKHNFVPSARPKSPVNMNAMRDDVLLAEDTDGSAALKIKINHWKEGKKGNIRALISTLQDILWEGSGWEEIPMSHLLKANQVKRGYMKACLIIHPDKVMGTENDKMANMVFDEINKAYTAFKEQGMPCLG